MTEETPNPVPHVHHYVLKGSGLSCWAECDGFHWAQSSASGVCGEKLAGDWGPIVGSRGKIEAAIAQEPAL